MPEIAVGTYAPAESDEALALDAACAQGGRLRLSFHRPAFHRRAARYPEHVILTARLAGRLVGTLAVAAKPAHWRGAPARAAFAFDLRVAPHARGRGVATALAREGLAWARRHADLVYAYTVDENRAAARVGGLMGLAAVGGYAYLVCPVAALAPAGGVPKHFAVHPVGYADAHGAFACSAGPFDLCADPELRPGDEGYVGSWCVRRADGTAVASAFCHAGTLAEVVERVPVPLRALRALAHAGVPWPRSWPRIPEDGEQLRSWYLFDAFADAAPPGCDLMSALAAEARRRRVDWLYLVHTRCEPWIEAVRRRLPRRFAPLLRYRLLLRHFGEPATTPLRSLHVDVRDL